MPRLRTIFPEAHPSGGGHLVERLATELRSDNVSGQPLIYEKLYPSNKLQVHVIWDAWAGVTLEERTAIILSAYEAVAGMEGREQIALASGLTIPEASNVGMLPFQIFPALREGDSVSLQECLEAMKAEGASTLMFPTQPLLCFATEREAEAARNRLVNCLSGSRGIWQVLRQNYPAEVFMED